MNLTLVTGTTNGFVVVNFLSQVIFIFPLFQLRKHTLPYPKRKEKQKLPEIFGEKGNTLKKVFFEHNGLHVKLHNVLALNSLLFPNLVLPHEIPRCVKITKSSCVACSFVDFFSNLLIPCTVSGFVEGYNFLFFFSVLFIQMWIILIVVIIVIIAAIVSKCTCNYIT